MDSLKYQSHPRCMAFPKWFYKLSSRISDEKFEKAFEKALAETQKKLLKAQRSHLNNLNHAERIGAL